MPKVAANGLNFHVNRYNAGGDGERPIVVCIHGLAVADSSASSFVLGFDLAKDAEVIAYDLRGHGRSDVVPSGYRVTDHAADLMALLDALDVTAPVHLVGFSYGGAVAMVAAMRHPERMASLCLLDGVVPLTGWGTSIKVMENLLVWTREAREYGASGDQIAQALIEKLNDEHDVPLRRATALANRIRRLVDGTTFDEDIRDEPVFDDKDDYQRITCPVLGIYGDESDLYWQTDVLPALLPDVTIHTMAGAGHLEVYWRIAEIRPVIRRFLGLPHTNSNGRSPT